MCYRTVAYLFNKVPKFYAFIKKDRVLGLLLLGVCVPLLLLVLGFLLNLVGVRVKLYSGFGDYLLYTFVVSFFLVLLYIPFFKKPVTSKTLETKVFIFIWLLISLVILTTWAKITSFEVASNLDGFQNSILLLLPISAVLFLVGIPFLIIDYILVKSSIQKRQKVVFSICLVVFTALLTTPLVYALKPSRAVIQIYPWDLKEGKQFSCATKIGATLFPRPNFEGRIYEMVDGNLFTRDETKLAIEIDGSELKMLTTSSVEIGITEPARLVIVKEDENLLIAIDPELDSYINRGVGTFILNKKSGTAVWTKSKPSILNSQMPYVQMYYMECR
ncbi:MAG: hypothetical protein ABIG91_00310 [Patescibacteria group bacterium]